MDDIPAANSGLGSPAATAPPPQSTPGSVGIGTMPLPTDTGPTTSSTYDPFPKKEEVPLGQRSSSLKPKVSLFDRQGVVNMVVVFGVLSIIIGASICSLSGIIFRPAPPESDWDSDDYDDYHNDIDTRNQVSSFIYMVGSTILLIGLLLVMLKMGLIVVSGTFPTGLRITAGILLAIMIPIFLSIFIMAGPARLLAHISGGDYYYW